MQNRLIHLIGLVLAVALSSVYAEPLPLQREDIFQLEWVSSPKISPDGKRVVYARNSMDIMQDTRTSRLWLIDVDGTHHEPLTGADVKESAPIWSPDGTRIAYVSGSEIHLHWLKTGKSVRLTQLDRAPKDLSWSPDGARIAFAKRVPESPAVLVKPLKAPKQATWAPPPRVTTRLRHERDGSGRIEPGFLQYFVLPADGGTPRQVTSGRFRHDGAAQWLADSSGLIFSGNRNADWETKHKNSELYRVSLVDGSIDALTSRDGPDGEVAVSPDGQWIAWTSYEDKVQTYQVPQLHVMDLQTRKVSVLAGALDRRVSRPTWNASSTGIYFQYPDQGSENIGYVSLSDDVRVVASDLGGEAVARPYGGGSFSISDRNQIAFSHSSPYRPAEVGIVDRRGQVSVITDLNADALDHRQLGEVEEIRYTASTDGLEIQGWIVKPPGYSKDTTYPLLVENHGGPISHYGPHFSPEVQLYAAAEYLVFYPNPRGSTGYGEAFGNLLHNNYPGDDYQDVMDGIDYLVAQGLTSPGQLYVTGGSAGGIMTTWMIGKSDRFRAAVVVKPVMNWISKALTADNHYGYANYRYEGQPWENIETYMKFSPVSLVGSIDTPTLVMVGDEDLRTPLSEAKQLYHALKIRQIDTALVEMPGASHFIAKRPSQLVSKIDHVLAWLEKYPPKSGSLPD